MSDEGETRTAFARDRDRLLYTPELRRLAGVTQVVSASEGHVFHNRLTHTMKVAQISRRLAEKIDKNEVARRILSEKGLTVEPEVVEAAALAHDLGHPPFGHIAEEELDDLIVHEGKTPDGYEGNAQSFRIVCKTAVRSTSGVGLDLTRATLNAILKYPWPRGTDGKSRKKWGYYSTERKEHTFARASHKADDLEPCVEAQLMTLADDITYSVHDMSDFYQAGLVPLELLVNPALKHLDTFLANVNKRAKNGKFKDYDIKELERVFKGLISSFIVTEPYMGTQDQRRCLQATNSLLISRYVENAQVVLEGTMAKVKIDEEYQMELVMLQQLTWEYVILKPSLASQQYGQRMMIKKLYDVFQDAVESGPEKWVLLPIRYSEEMHGLRATHGNSIPAVEKIRVIADAISGMTEQQVLQMYQRLTGTTPGSVLDKIMV